MHVKEQMTRRNNERNRLFVMLQNVLTIICEF